MDNEKFKDCSCGCEEANDENCGCGCGCDEQENIKVDLEDENGNIVSCEVVDEFTYEEIKYVLVQNPEDDSVYLFKVEENGEEDELVVPDDEEFEKASAYYENLLEDEE